MPAGGCGAGLQTARDNPWLHGQASCRPETATALRRRGGYLSVRERLSVFSVVGRGGFLHANDKEQQCGNDEDRENGGKGKPAQHHGTESPVEF